MVIPTAFDDAVGYIRVLIGVALLDVVIGIGIPDSSLTLVTRKCIAGDFEVSAMVLGSVLSYCFIIYAIGLICYDMIYFIGDANLKTRDILTRHLYNIIVCVYSVIVFAYMKTCITFFFMLEVKYRKFQCQALIIFQYGISSLVIGIIVGCSNIIYYVWQTPHQ